MASKPGVRMTLDRVRQAQAAVRAIGRDRVLVGIPAENAFRTDTKEPTNAALGYILDRGSPARNIPARPWLIPGVQNAQQEIGERLESSIRRTLAGDIMDVDRTLHTVGLVAQNAVRQKITDGPFVPLSPVTLAKRRAKGRTGTKPLIDTTQMRAAVTYVVRAR